MFETLDLIELSILYVCQLFLCISAKGIDCQRSPIQLCSLVMTVESLVSDDTRTSLHTQQNLTHRSL